MKFGTMENIAAQIQGRLIKGTEPDTPDSVCHDSRIAGPQDLFFCLVGENQDGHDFIDQAIERGCRNFVVSKASKSELIRQVGANGILVEDTTLALGKMAQAYLKDQGISVVGVTGSTGKTSTKDMVAAVLAEKFNVGKTQGNFNNHIGLPLSVLSLEPETQVVVLEMGMDRRGEIDYLAQITRPTVAIITNIGTAHLEHLKTRENIFRAKMEITNYFQGDNTLIFYRGKDFLIKENMDIRGKTYSCGVHSDDDIMVKNIVEDCERGLAFQLESQGRQASVQLNLLGKHHSYNGALAVAAGLAMGLTLKEAVAGLKKTRLTRGRMSCTTEKDITVLDDCYNAGPDSMSMAIDSLSSFAPRRRVAVLGDMFELGKEEIKYHRQMGQRARERDIDRVIAIGDLARHIAQGAADRGVHFASKEDFLEKIETYVQPGDVVLVKGSRKMALEEVVEKIKKIDRSNL